MELKLLDCENNDNITDECVKNLLLKDAPADALAGAAIKKIRLSWESKYN
jgi:hypothetical protein